LRPDIPHKSGTVPSNDDRSPLVDKRPSVTSEVSRPSCNAAAILGIAMTIGTGSIIAPGFQAVAQANEPASTQVSVQSAVVVQEPLLTSIPQSQVAVVPQIEPQVVERSLTTAAAPITAVTSVVAPTPAENLVGSSTAHAVKPGETLWQIAQSYQIEVRALANANRLSTVSVLKVGQVLQLPTATEASFANGTINFQAIAQSVPVVPVLGSVDKLTSDTPAGRTEVVADRSMGRDRFKRSLAELGEASKSASMVFTEGQSEALAAAAAPTTTGGLPVTRLANVPLPAIGGEEPQMIVRKAMAAKVDVAVPVVPQPVAPTEFNPTPLLAEIHNLRNRYNQRQLMAQVVPTETATRIEPLKAQSVAVNPDFANRKSDSALSIELRNFVQPKLKPEATGKVKSAPSANAQVVARASLGSEAYAPVTPAVRRMVAPNLPAIGKADAYLPGGGSSSGMVWPAQGMLSSGFGWRWGRPHKGIDIAAPIGTPIVAAASGKVAYAGWNDGGYGYVVEVEHEDGTMTRYAHNDRILVKDGQQVNQGQQISEMGTTGHSTGPHLHFEVHPRGGEAVNPMAFLNNQS
jgi:murein DD-endopeptidase MepM/ murein hydrolase activator NlpD